MIPPANGYLILFIALDILSAGHRCIFQRNSPKYPHDWFLSGNLYGWINLVILQLILSGGKSAQILIKQPVTVPGSAVYRGTNKLLQKTFWKTFCIFQNKWKILVTIFFRRQYRFRMMISLPKRSPTQTESLLETFQVIIEDL